MLRNLVDRLNRGLNPVLVKTIVQLSHRQNKLWFFCRVYLSFINFKCVWLKLWKGFDQQGSQIYNFMFEWQIIRFYRDVLSVHDRLYYLSICLFGVFRTTREFFTHLETSPLLQFFTYYSLHSWPLSIVGGGWGWGKGG